MILYLIWLTYIFLQKKNTKIGDSGSYKEILKFPIDEKFIEWFVGICEAESNFLIRKIKNKNEVTGFEFVFRIALHVDDSKVL